MSQTLTSADMLPTSETLTPFRGVSYFPYVAHSTLKGELSQRGFNKSTPAVELHTVTPKPALLLSLNKHMQTIARDGTFNINNRISDTSNKVTNRRLQHVTIETVVKVITAKPRTIQHHTKTITSARLNLSKRSPRSGISRRSRRTINHDRTLTNCAHPHTP